jgi:hypothetical protein
MVNGEQMGAVVLNTARLARRCGIATTILDDRGGLGGGGWRPVREQTYEDTFGNRDFADSILEHQNSPDPQPTIDFGASRGQISEFSRVAK